MGSDEPERIEIELTPSVPGERERRFRPWGRGRFRSGEPRDRGEAPAFTDITSTDTTSTDDHIAGAETVTEPAPSRPSPTRWSLGDRARPAVVGVVFAVAGLLLGWVLGRSVGGGERTARDQAPVTTDSADRPELAAVFESSEELPGVDLGSDAAVPREVSTMTTAPIDSRGSVDIAPQLRGIELTLVGVTVDRRLVDLDLASGLGRVRAPDGLAFEVGRLYAGRDWVGISTVSGTDLLVVGDDDSYHAITIADPWGLIYDRTTGRFWTDTQRGGRSREVQEVDTFGDPTGRSVTIPGRDWPIGADQGALVVQAPGMVYRVTPEDSELLARGELIGLSERVAVVFACDASFDCGMSAIDRETGVARPVPIEPDDPDTIGDGIVGMWSFGLGVNGSVSPDGRRVVGGRADRSRVDFGVLDLDTGEFVVLPGSGFVSSAMWTPDGKYLLYASAGRLRAFDTRSGEAFAVLVEPERWLAVTARPSSPVGADAR